MRSFKFPPVSAGQKVWPASPPSTKHDGQGPICGFVLPFIIESTLKDSLQLQNGFPVLPAKFLFPYIRFWWSVCFICNGSNEPSACLNICDSLGHGSLKRSQAWYLVGFLGPPYTCATTDVVDAFCSINFCQVKVFTASFRVVSSLCKRKCVGDQLCLKLSTYWSCSLSSCNNICILGYQKEFLSC